MRQTRLRAADGVEISAMHLEGRRADLCFVLVHGFTGTWRAERVQRIARALTDFGGVVAIDMRGHGRSGGSSTVGRDEVLDVAAGVQWARRLGFPRVVTIGFSMGGAVVLREAALAVTGEIADGRVDGVVSVSAPAFWFYRGTRIMRLVHRAVQTGYGRLVLRARGTRISPSGWSSPLPIAPHEAAALLERTPLLVVHGDVDRYFPLEHARAIHAAAERSGVPVELWSIDGFGHAESAVSDETLDRIGAWARECALGATG